MTTPPQAAFTSSGMEQRASEFSDLVAHAYESACRPEDLVHFVRDTAEYFAAPQCAVAIWSEDHPDTFLPITHGMTGDELKTLFNQRHQSGTLFASLTKLRSGETMISTVPERPGSAAVAGNQHAATHSIAGLVLADGSNRCAMFLFRGEQSIRFDPSEQAALARLMKYYRRAIDLNNRFIRLSVEHNAALAALEFAPRAIIFLGQSGQIAYQNSAARMILAKNDGLRESQGSVHIDDSMGQKKLDEYIEQAHSIDATACPDSMICKIPRHSSAAAYQLIVSKIQFNARRAALNDGELLAMIIIHNPDDLIDLNAKFLRTFYELSPAEARLAQALYKYHTLTNAAESLGISVHTARSELKHVFKKVGVKSQSALLVEFTKTLRESGSRA